MKHTKKSMSLTALHSPTGLFQNSVAVATISTNRFSRTKYWSLDNTRERNAIFRLDRTIHTDVKFKPLLRLITMRAKTIDNLQTSPDRPKSAPYQKLKNSKRTSKSQFTVLENRKSEKMDRVARRGPLAQAPGALKGGHIGICQQFCRS